MILSKPNVLTVQQLKAIELFCQGMSVSDVARSVDCARTTVSSWKNNNKMFRAELDKQRKALETGVHDQILLNINPIIKRVINIATTCKNDKTALDACIYAINRLCGTPTNKTEDITEASIGNEKIDIKAMLNEINNPNITLPVSNNND